MDKEEYKQAFHLMLRMHLLMSDAVFLTTLRCKNIQNKIFAIIISQL